jgi:hypothetical protein
MLFSLRSKMHASTKGTPVVVATRSEGPVSVRAPLTRPTQLRTELKMPKSKATENREKIRAEFWPKVIAWTGDEEKGWFRAPRTLPLVLMLLRSKKVSGNADPTGVYLELLARHRDSGVVDMHNEGDHSYTAGYAGPRGTRTWQERMKMLEQLGFIKSSASGNQQYRYVVLVHPSVAVQRLRDAGQIDDIWWGTYRQRQIENKEATYEKLVPPAEAEKAVSIKGAKKKDAKKKDGKKAAS